MAVRTQEGTFMDQDETAVIFRRDRNGTGITAVFPCIPADCAGNLMSCYAHIGQHGQAAHAWFYACRPARPEEYEALKKELESAPYGYRLKVYHRLMPWMNETRRKA